MPSEVTVHGTVTNATQPTQPGQINPLALALALEQYNATNAMMHVYSLFQFGCVYQRSRTLEHASTIQCQSDEELV